jgi:hypothetical protein
MSTYGYRALADDEGTRLVRLKPAKDLNDELVCELINVSLDPIPNFDALSYVWSNSAHRTPDQMTQEEKDVKGTCVTVDGEKIMTYSVNWEEMGRSEIEEVRGLFYQLGGERNECTILLDNHAFQVGFELGEAMRRLRYQDEERLVWSMQPFPLFPISSSYFQWSGARLILRYGSRLLFSLKTYRFSYANFLELTQFVLIR